MKINLLRIYLCLLTFFSLAPVHLIFPNFFDHEENYFSIFNLVPSDKLMHFIMYLILGYLTHLAYPFKKQLLASCILFGLLMEILQYFIPYRSFEIMDLIANTTGIILIFALTLRQKPIS